MKFHEQLVLFVCCAAVCFLSLDRLQQFAKTEQARLTQERETAAKSAYDEAYVQGKNDGLLAERQRVWDAVNKLEPCQAYQVYDPDSLWLARATSIVLKRASCKSVAAKGANAK